MISNRLVAITLCYVVVVLGGLPLFSNAQLDPYFYSKTCPQLHFIVHKVVWKASLTDPRIFASLVRLHFHDCFVQAHGPFWKVPLGRRDSLTANQTLANQNLPAPFFTLDQLKASFVAQGLNTTDLVVLSGAHTFGRSRCSLFVDRLYNFNSTGKPDPTLDTSYFKKLRKICPQNGTGTNLANLDPTTPNKFDNNYYSNLKGGKGLFQSDQELFSTPNADTVSIVNKFSNNKNAFFDSFKVSMVKMGNIGVLTGNKGEIRKQCNFINKKSNELDIEIVASKESPKEDVVSSI